MTWKVVTPMSLSGIFVQSEEEAIEQAALLKKKWNVETYHYKIAACCVCGGEREDDLSYECNGCLMEMASFYQQN